MKNYRLKIFCDFDGTISKNDVWINTISPFVNDYSGFEMILEEFNSGKIGAREIGRKHLELVENFSLDKFNHSIDKEEIDESFRDFLTYCNEEEIELCVVSGGWDHYIDRILKREKIDLKVYSSKLVIDEHSNKLSTSYEHSDEYCTMCETCKRNILINNTNDYDNEISVFIGDGISDYCVSNFADVVFAKGKLASYCWKNNITYFEYVNFTDVKNKLVKLTEQKKLKHRQESKFRRRDVIMGG
jgi:2,3-diketo-5-methylthio-1-phosphopentane phosphatase